jgi:hypothetical protein
MVDTLRDVVLRLAVLEAKDAAKDRKIAEMQRQLDKRDKRGLPWLHQNRADWPTGIEGFKLAVTQHNFDALVEEDLFVAWGGLFAAGSLPFCAFRESPGVIYVFSSETGWREASRAELVAFFTRTQAAFGSFIDAWEQRHDADICAGHPGIVQTHKKLVQVSMAYLGDNKWFAKLRSIMYDQIHDAPP